MMQNGGTDRWRDLIGVGGMRMEWDRAAAFCFAFAASDLLAYYLWWTETLNLPRPWREMWGFYALHDPRFSFGHLFGSANILFVFAVLLFLAASTVVIFRFLPGRILPVLLSALVYGLVFVPMDVHG